MNVLGYEPNKKKWILISSVALLVLVGILIFIFWGDAILKDKPNTPKEPQIIEDEDTVWSENGNYQFEQSVENPSEGSEDVQVVVPSTLYGGSVESYTDVSTSAELKIHIAGDVDRSKTFKLIPTGIVFDANKNAVVKPSSLERGNTVRILATGDLKTGQETVEVVIVNDNSKVIYSPVLKVNNEGKTVSLLNTTTATKYTLSEKAKVTNALTGEVYEKGKIKAGDRVFFYESSQQESAQPQKEESKSKDGKILDNKDKEAEKDYKTVVVLKAYIYPSAENK